MASSKMVHVAQNEVWYSKGMKFISFSYVNEGQNLYGVEVYEECGIPGKFIFIASVTAEGLMLANDMVGVVLKARDKRLKEEQKRLESWTQLPLTPTQQVE